MDLDGVWFRYHRLFAQYLIRRLQTRFRKLKLKLHGTAARWLAERDQYQEAINQALSSEDKEYAAELIERGGRIALQEGKFSTLRTWLQALPQDVARTNPYLCVFAAIVDVVFGQLDQAQADLNDLDHALQTSDKEPLPGMIPHVISDILRAYLRATLNKDISPAKKLLRQILWVSS